MILVLEHKFSYIYPKECIATMTEMGFLHNWNANRVGKTEYAWRVQVYVIPGYVTWGENNTF